MGCGSSRQYSYQADIDTAWKEVEKTIDVQKNERRNKKLVVKRSGWKTIRIFVSSTFKDFHEEREVLVKQVFPDLRQWCELRQLHLVECDLRWGVPKDTKSEETLRICLGEIDRCYADNVMPFFLNLTSERSGWIPNPGEVPKSVIDDYRWVMGLSLTEMEIMHGAYRRDNPNSLFMIRDSSFLQDVPKEHQANFLDPNPVASHKLKVLKDMIKKRFPDSQLHMYKCEYAGVGDNGKPRLRNLEKFCKQIYDFFLKRISDQYPLENVTRDPYQQALLAHEAFMKSRCLMVLGRNDILKKIDDYVESVSDGIPLILVGGAGSGKSSIMARVADKTVTKALAGDIPGAEATGWHVFYHFVGAVPGSTDLEKALKRLLIEIGAVNEATLPKNLEETCQTTCALLSNPNVKPVIIIIDALNQFDDDSSSFILSWLPRKLAPQVRCIFSMIPKTPPHKMLMERSNPPLTVTVSPLDIESRQEIILEILGRYNKRLDKEQMKLLLANESSQNPLWLAIACEEIRVFGLFEKINEKIASLADGLLELLEQVLSRFETENGGHLLVGALCLLETSSTGLLETELLEILGDEENLMRSESNNPSAAASSSSSSSKGPLPAVKWAAVYRALKPFLRPFGDSGEGRLDFYHRSLSKAVRRKYFLNPDDVEDDDDSRDKYQWWHNKLANFFENCDNLERKIEEYPIHLVKTDNKEKLAEFLTDWRVFDRLYHEEYSGKLLHYWRKAGGSAKMEQAYLNSLENLKNSLQTGRDELAIRYEQVSRVFQQENVLESSQKLLDSALAIEEDELGGRQERLVDLYDLAATIYNEKLVAYDFIQRQMMPTLKPCLEFRMKSIKLREALEGDKNRFKKAFSLMKWAFNIKTWYILGGDSTLPPDVAMEQAFEHLAEAKQIFSELNELGYLAECIMNEGLLVGETDKERSYELHKESLEICLQALGPNSVLTTRIMMNTGICVEEMGDFEAAYDYFLKTLIAKIEVFGRDHPTTQRLIRIFEESTYTSMSQQRGENPLTL